MFSKFFTRKILLVLILTLVFSSFVAKKAFAFNTNSGVSYYLNFENAVYRQPDTMNLQSFVNETFKALGGSIVTNIVGCVSCTEAERKQQGTSFLETTSSLLASVYSNPPASGIEYIADIGSRLNIVQPAYAQNTSGIGWEKMLPFFPVWKAFRNLSYSLFIVVLIFMGFAIMFRVKISPQAVISIQSALPKMIMALILITFSYAIVGFLVDIMWVINNLIVNLFRNIPEIPSSLTSSLPNTVTNAWEVTNLIHILIITPFVFALVIFMIIGVVAYGVAVVGTATGSAGVVTGAALAGGISLLVTVIVGLLLLIAFLRVLWSLLKAYVQVGLALIFGPFQIMLGVLPGSNSISGWFKGLIANLAVLPVTLAMMFVAGSLLLISIFTLPGKIGESLFGSSQTTMVGAIQTAASNPDMVGASFSVIMMFFVSIGILLLTPKVSDIIQGFISGKPFGYGTAIGETFVAAGKAANMGYEMGERWERRGGNPVARRIGGFLGNLRSTDQSSGQGSAPKNPPGAAPRTEGRPTEYNEH